MCNYDGFAINIESQSFYIQANVLLFARHLAIECLNVFIIRFILTMLENSAGKP